MSDSRQSGATGPNTPSSTVLVAVLTLTVLALFGLVRAFAVLPCGALAAIAVLAAVPLWLFRAQRVLLTRLAVIRYVGTDAGFIRRWFSTGTFTLVLQVFVALGLAMVMLVFMSALQRVEWLILAADGLLLGLIYNLSRRSLVVQIREEHGGLINRLWPMTIVNVTFLLIVFVTMDLVTGHTVIQGSWDEVAREAFRRGSQGINCSVAGLVLGVAAVLDQLPWQAAIKSIPGLSGAGVKLVLWALFLAWTGFGAVLFTQFMLGVVAFVEDRTGARAGKDHIPTHWRAFILTTLVLVVLSVYVSSKLPPPPPPPPPPDPCAQFQFDGETLRVALSRDIDKRRRETTTMADSRVDVALTRAFDKADKGVDKYLDWYFSLYGDYSRLLALVSGNLDNVMREQLTEHIFTNSGFTASLTVESDKIREDVITQMSSVADQLSARTKTTIDASKCPRRIPDLSELINLKQDKLRLALSSTVALAAVKLVTSAAMKNTVAAAARKAATSTSVKLAGRVAKKIVAKGSASAVAGATGVALCTPGGPLAIACGITAGVITWVAVDMAAITINEQIRRDKMREELRSILGEHRRSLEKELMHSYAVLANYLASDINSCVREFVPIEDGMKPQSTSCQALTKQRVVK